MQAHDYCRLKVAPPGSDLHYSLLGLATTQRQVIIALHALRQELDEIANIREQQIAQSKLHWWFEELQRLFVGQTRHPVTQALSPAVAQLPETEIMALAHSITTLLSYDAYPDFAALRQYCEQAGSNLHKLQTRILGYQQPQTLCFAHELGVVLELFKILQNLANSVQQGRFFIPEQELNRFAVSYQDLMQARSPALPALLRYQAERIRDSWQTALALLPDQDRYQQRSQLILAELALTVLTEIEADDLQVMHQRIVLTPLRKLWIAWRVLRRERN